MKITRFDINLWFMKHDWAEPLLYLLCFVLLLGLVTIFDLLRFCVKMHMIKSVFFFRALMLIHECFFITKFLGGIRK